MFNGIYLDMNSAPDIDSKNRKNAKNRSFSLILAFKGKNWPKCDILTNFSNVQYQPKSLILAHPTRCRGWKMSFGLRKIFLIFCSTEGAFKTRQGPLETKFSDPKTVQFFKIISKLDALPHPDEAVPNIIFDNEIQVRLPPAGLTRIARTIILVTPIYQIIAKFISCEIVSATKIA